MVNFTKFISTNLTDIADGLRRPQVFPGTQTGEGNALRTFLFGTRLHFQTVAFQVVVVAQQHDGDTMRHACGICQYTRGARASIAWRPCAGMFRGACAAHHRWSTPASTQTGTWSSVGLSVLCFGDFCQRDPPDGGFRGHVPADLIRRVRNYQPAPTRHHNPLIRHLLFFRWTVGFSTYPS